MDSEISRTAGESVLRVHKSPQQVAERFALGKAEAENELKIFGAFCTSEAGTDVYRCIQMYTDVYSCDRCDGFAGVCHFRPSPMFLLYLA